MLTIPNTDTLTHAEAKVLALVEAGHSNRMIAATLTITVGTVKSHLHRSFEKLQARNRLEAIERARVQGHFSTPGETLAACKT